MTSRRPGRSILRRFGLPDPNLSGYIHLDDNAGRLLVRYCRPRDGQVTHVRIYRRVGSLRSMLLWMAILLRALDRIGRFVIDAVDVDAFDASAYRHRNGRIYFLVPSRGWFGRNVAFDPSSRPRLR